MLQEYINTLIFNLVTGKVDVRDFEIPELNFETKELEEFSYLEKVEEEIAEVETNIENE